MVSASVLLSCTALYAVIAELLVDVVDVVLQGAGVDEKFLDVTLFALVPNTTEFMNAISFALNGNIALSMEIGSAYALQVCLLQIPAMIVLSAWYAPNKLGSVADTFTLTFPRWDVIAIILSVFLMTYTYIANQIIKQIIQLCVEGAKIPDICLEGDGLIEQGTGAAVYNMSVKGVKVSKGLAFPTSVSVNNCVVHFSPLASDLLSSQTLATDDDVKLHVGAHIDGFATISAETLVVGASESNPITGRRADVLKAAWTAAETAMRLVKAGNKNWAITDTVSKVTAAWDCKAVEGMLSCQQEQNLIDGKNRVILNPSESQRPSSEDGKARLEESRTTMYLRSRISRR